MNETNGNSNGHVSNGNGAADIPSQIGCDLAYAAAEDTDDRAARFCSTERQRLEAANAPKIAAAKQDLAGVECELEKTAHKESALPPEGDLRTRRWTARLLFAFAVGLCIGGFASAIYALDPIMPGL